MDWSVGINGVVVFKLVGRVKFVKVLINKVFGVVIELRINLDCLVKFFLIKKCFVVKF